MKVEIHYEINDYEDFYVLEGDNFEDIQKLNAIEMKRRGLDADKNNCWSKII